MNTPDTEDWEKEFDSFFQARIWNTKEGETLGHWNAPDVFTMKKFISSTVSSRDTYWKERVRKEVEYSRDWICSRGSHPQEYSSHLNTVSVSLVEKTFKKLDTLLDNLK